MGLESTRFSFVILLVAFAVAGCGGSHTVEDAGVDAGADDAGADEDAGPVGCAADGASCDDGDPCTTGDVCTGGTCAGAAMTCDDGDVCTTDACSAGECVTTPVDDGTSCDDGDACTDGDMCAGGVCGGAALDCSHLDAVCEAGSCDAGGCVSTPLSGTPCDAGELCSWADLCDAGTCAAGTITDCGPIEGGGAQGVQETTLSGGPGGGPFADDCPLGQLPIGVEASVSAGFYEQILHQFVMRCGALELDGGALTITPAARVPAEEEEVRGTSPYGTPASPVSCPDGHVVAGFSGSTAAEGFVTQVTLRCAPLTLAGTADAGYTLSVGATVAGPTIGTRADTPIADTDCPAGMVARGMHGNHGDVLDRFGLRCGTPTLRIATTAPPAGTSSGAAVNDDCPPGEVPVGVTASVAEGDRAGALTEYSTQCAALTVMDDGSGGWAVTLTPGASLPAGDDGHGTWATFGVATTVSCPEGQVVVGASGTAGAHVEQLTLRCAPLVVSGDLTSGLVVAYGSLAEGPSVGAAAAGSAFGPHDCPAGTVASGFRVYAGEVVDGIALRCAAVAATVAAPVAP